MPGRRQNLVERLTCPSKSDTALAKGGAAKICRWVGLDNVDQRLLGGAAAVAVERLLHHKPRNVADDVALHR